MSTPVLKRIVVASYETTDGKTFATKSEAQSHQRDLTRINELDALVKRGMSDGVTTVNDSMAAQIAAFILVYGDEIREILPKRAASAAPVKLETPEPGLPAQPVENVPQAQITTQTIAGVELVNGQLPVNPLAAAVQLPSAADAELAELMAGLDVATA